MDSQWLLWAMAALLLALAIASSVLSFACARAAWRRHLDRGMALWGSPHRRALRLRGWAATLVGSAVAAGSGYYALPGWYGCFWVLGLSRQGM